MGSFFSKSFDIELADSLTYPSASVICQTILDKEGIVEIVSTQNPVSFKKDNIIFEVEVKMARGGYILICKEQK